MAFLLTVLVVTQVVLSCGSQTPHSSLASSLVAGLEQQQPAGFLSQCVHQAGLQCSGLLCQGEDGRDLSLELLQHQQCRDDADCLQEATGLKCSRGRCDCPHYTAFNVSSCSCQDTASCHYPLVHGVRNKTGCTEHNGRRCQDPYCSCYSSTDYSDLLLDPTSLFCVLPAGPEDLARGGATSIGLAVLGALLGFLSVVILAVLIVAMYKHCVCERVGQANIVTAVITFFNRGTTSATPLTETSQRTTLLPGTTPAWTMSAKMTRTLSSHCARYCLTLLIV